MRWLVIEEGLFRISRKWGVWNNGVVLQQSVALSRDDRLQ